MTAEPKEIIETIETILNSDEKIYEKWIARADILLKVFLNGKLINKYEGIDIVHTLVQKFCDGDRKWNKEKYPGFEIYFFMCIKSHISNLAKYEEKLDGTSDYEEEMEDNAHLVMDDVNFLSAKEILSNKDANELYNLSLINLKGDEEAAYVFMAAAEFMKNQEIAEDLGMTVAEVEAAKKRVRRSLKDLFDEFLERKKGVEL